MFHEDENVNIHTSEICEIEESSTTLQKLCQNLSWLKQLKKNQEPVSGKTVTAIDLLTVENVSISEID